MSPEQEAGTTVISATTVQYLAWFMLTGRDLLIVAAAVAWRLIIGYAWYVSERLDVWRYREIAMLVSVLSYTLGGLYCRWQHLKRNNASQTHDMPCICCNMH